MAWGKRGERPALRQSGLHNAVALFDSEDARFDRWEVELRRAGLMESLWLMARAAGAE